MPLLHPFRFLSHAACLAALALLPGFLCNSTHAQAQDAAAPPTIEDALGLPPQPAPPAASPAGPETESVSDLLKKIESDEATRPAMPGAAVEEMPPQPDPLTPVIPAPGPQVVDEDLTPQPAQDALLPPGEPGPIDEAMDVSGVPAPPPGPVDENMFFDSESIGESPSERPSGIPQNVDPGLAPASRLNIVTKNFDAGTDQAQMVAAGRAVQLRRYDSALRIYNQLYEKNARDPNVLLGRAVALQNLGQNEEAIRSYEELLDIRPENIEAQINMLGLIGERYPAVALQRLRSLSDNNPNDVRILAQAAVVQARFGDYDEALASLGMAASMDQNNANHVYNMAVVADRAGKKDEAVRYYEKALEIDAIYGGSRTIPRESVYERLAQIR